MSAAGLLAAAAAAFGVLAAWSALAAAEHGFGQLVAAAGPDGRLARLLAPMRRGHASAGERRRLLLTGALCLLAGGWLLAGPVAGFAAAAAAPALAGRALAAGRRRRRERLADEAPAVARAIADALAGGHSVRGALAEAVGGGVAGPARAELARLAGELAAGARTERALERWRARAAHPAYDALAAAVLLQRDAGGDLASLLRGLAEALEAQVRAEADARGLTSQARFTALVVALLPLAGAVLVELASPGTVRGIVTQPMSAILVATSLGLQLLAALSVRRISRLAT